MKTGFLDKLIERLDRVEPGEVQAYLTRLVQEKGVFERVLESLEEGVIVMDGDGKITFLNSAACRLLGLQRDSVLEQTIGERIRGFDLRAVLGERGKAVSRDIEVSYPEHRFLNFFLSPLESPEDAVAAEVAGEGGATELLGYVMLVRDITQSRLATQEIIESERMNALTMLAAGVAHEIGNPLNSLTIHLQLLDRKLRQRDAGLHAELGEMIDVAQGEIKRLDQIVKQFLAAIRPTVPQTELLDINELVRESLRVLGPEFEDRGIGVVQRLGRGVPLLPLDGTQVKQAFYNLAKNAYQSMVPGGTLTVSSGLVDGEVEVAFADDGGGIPQEVMSNIFQPYFTTRSSGTGLGLLIVRRIVREHGGEIGIESEEGNGTVVTLHFPAGDRGPRLLGDGEEEAVIDV